MRVPDYIVERWPFGWLVCAAEGQAGVPCMAMKELVRLFPKKSIMDLGIARHYEVAGRRSILCVTNAANQARWRADIAESLSSLPPCERWWKGLDVGTSSAAMFAALCPDSWLASRAREYSRDSTPRDADDLSRCLKLLVAIPEFKARLGEVAAAYPDTAWPKIIARWPELEAASYPTQSAILTRIGT